MCLALGKRDKGSELHCVDFKWSGLCGTSICVIYRDGPFTSISDHDPSLCNDRTGRRLWNVWQVVTSYIDRYMLGRPIRQHEFDM